MPSATDLGDVGILCRDVGFLSKPDGGFSTVDFTYEGIHQRKGSDKYANALALHLGYWRPRRFDQVVVIGDGEGDVRLCKNIENLADDVGFGNEVSGLFIAHSALERFRNDVSNIRLYGSWLELSTALAALLRDAKKASHHVLLLADIDRTILLPRVSHDSEYSRVRLEGITDYVLSFRRPAGDERFEPAIARFIDHVSANLFEYTNELDALCFKNEEVVALVVFLLSVGISIKSWIDRARPKSLRDLLRYAIHWAEHGGWISGLDSEMEGSDRYVLGDLRWNPAQVAAHLRIVQEDYRLSRPVISSTFRRAEARSLGNLVMARQRSIFNIPLIGALRSGISNTLLFVSDRPAISLDLNPNVLDGSLGNGAFWNVLRQSLEDAS